MDELREPVDDGLRTAFAELRAVDRAGLPDLDEVLSASPVLQPRSVWLRRGLWSTGLAAAAISGILLVRQTSELRRFEAVLSQASQETRLGSWTGPTDFLLDYSGRAFYSSLPTIMDPVGESFGELPGSSDTTTDEGRES